MKISENTISILRNLVILMPIYYLLPKDITNNVTKKNDEQTTEENFGEFNV